MIDRFLDLVRHLKRLENMKMSVMPIRVCSLATVPTGLEEGMNRDYADYSIVKISIDSRSLAVTPGKENWRKATQLTLV